MSEHEFIEGGWAVVGWPEPDFATRRWVGVKARGGTIVITRLRREELALDGGRFKRFADEPFEHLVPFSIPLKYGYGPDCDDRGLNDILDSISEHTVGRWCLRLAEKPFKASVIGLPAQFDLADMKWPYPVFSFEDHTDAVKLMLMKG